MTRIAFIGLGVMGGPIARHLSGAGHHMTVYNRSRAKAETWVAVHGGALAMSPAEAAKDAEVVISCVGTDDDLAGVTLGRDGAFAAMVKGSLYIDHTTVSARIARQLGVEAKSRGLLMVDAPLTGGQIGAENGTLAIMCGGSEASMEAATPIMERISIKLFELAAMPKASQRLLDDSAFDVEGWLAGKIATRFIRAEAAAFINGDGVDKPKGILLPAKITNASWVWGSVGYVPTGTAADFAPTNAADAIVSLVYSLTADYRANATFVMNSKTAGTVRKMKDADGRFLWSDGLSAALPSLLMGYPVLVAEDMPDIAASTFAIAFGDFRAAYTIAERPDVRVLRDPFSAKPNVLFYANKRVGGDVTDFAAFKLLKFAVS